MPTSHRYLSCVAVFLVALSTSFNGLSAQDDLADVIERAEESVVRIETEDGLGSGFVIDSSGWIVTNVHVMAGAARAKAVFANGDEYEITGTYFIDENRDICVCQIDATGLKPISLASSLPRKGETVVALGSPKGLSFSATTGIVSAIREESDAKQQLGRPNIEGTWVQIDAALSGGNSGGPLINQRGEVVAMSTLASQGSAQNLNFGISIDDIKMRIEDAKSKGDLLALREGVGKVEMADVHVESEGIPRGVIPEMAINDYIDRGKDDYNDLSRDIKKNLREARDLLGEYRRGKLDASLGRDGMGRRQGRSSDRYYFGTQRLKDRVVKDQEKLVDRLDDVAKQLGSSADDKSLLALLMHAGPPLDTRDGNSVGFMDEGIVLHAYNDHDIVVLFEEVPYLMWVKETTGLSPGTTLTPGPVYVAGTETVVIPGEGSASLTILNSVLETEIEKALGIESVNLSDFRTWKDASGQFEIKAKLIKSDSSKVILEDEGGELITVQLDQLSPADRALLKK